MTWPGLGEFAAVFALVWITWANGSLHHELHGHDDARARSTFLLLVAMAAFIPEAGGERGAAFAEPGRTTAACTGTSPAPAPPRPWHASAPVLRGRRHSSSPSLVLLLSLPWGLAVARRLASGADSPGTPQA